MGNRAVDFGPASWRDSRYGFAGFCFVSLLAGWLVLRVALLCALKPASLPLGEAAMVFLSGMYQDVFAALVEMVPLLVWLLVMPDRDLSGGGRFVHTSRVSD